MKNLKGQEKNREKLFQSEVIDSFDYNFDVEIIFLIILQKSVRLI